MKNLLWLVRFGLALFSLVSPCSLLASGWVWAHKSVGKPEVDGKVGIQLLPVSLGLPEGCSSASPYALNNGSYPRHLVIGLGMNCETTPGRIDYIPGSWKNGSWSRVELPDETMGGYVESVSDDLAAEPTITVAILGGGTSRSWVKSAGQPLSELSLRGGMMHSNTAVISQLGGHIVGANSNFSNEVAVRWAKKGTGWSSPEKIAQGQAVATSDDGSVVAGNEGQEYERPWIWMANSADGGELIWLQTKARVEDVSPSGAMVVGSREDACPDKPPGCKYPIPVYWIMDNGIWAAHDLQALDGTDSVAEAVAEVNGQLIIVGYGWSKQNGGIMRGVVWIPGPDGAYGAPIRLEALGGKFDSWAEAIDINRHGVVLGWSDSQDLNYWYPVLWNLFGHYEQFQIHSGLNDAWYNPATPGQGFFINVFPDLGQVFLAWFSYDTERPDESISATVGEPGHRWLTAFGPYSENTALLDIEVTRGGVFDAANPPPSQVLDGSISLKFDGCNEGTLSYDIPSIGRQGVVPIERISSDNVPACEAQMLSSQNDPEVMADRNAGHVPEAVGFTINRGLNDAWYNPLTAGQGFFMNVFPGIHQMFLAWFTFDAERPDGVVTTGLGDAGHRWLTAYGPFDGSQAVLNIEITEGGVFDSATPAPTQRLDGTLTVDMNDCTSGTITYDITSSNRQGVIPIERIAPDNIELCEAIQLQ